MVKMLNLKYPLLCIFSSFFFNISGSLFAQIPIMNTYKLESLINASEEISLKIRQEKFNDVVSILNLYNINTLNYKELGCLCKANVRLTTKTIYTSNFDIELINAKCFEQIRNSYKVSIISSSPAITKTRLDTLLNFDQKYRNKINNFILSSKKDSVDFYFKLQEKFDIQNISELKVITKSNGYPNLYSIGYEISPLILILHSSLEDNMFFLSILKNQAEQRLVGWEDAMYVYQNMLFRFSYDFYNTFHGVNLSRNGHINWDDSFIFIYSLANFLFNNNFGVEIFLNYSYMPDNTSNNNLKEIKDRLEKFGIIKDQILIHNYAPNTILGLPNRKEWPFIIHFIKP
jgi:hypothetical protein